VAEELEEPTYELLRDYGSFELRRYASTIQARVQTTGSGRRPSTGGFRRIAGYIFGGNNARASILDGAPLPVGFGGLRDTFSEETMPVPPLQ